MNPIQLISDLRIGAASKAQLILLPAQMGISVVRVDIFSNPDVDTPEFVKEVLTRAGLFFRDLKTSATNGKHLAGLAVAMKSQRAQEFKIAAEENQYPTLLHMIGYTHEAIEAAMVPALQLPVRDYPMDMVDNPLAFSFSIVKKEEQFALVRSWMKYVEKVAKPVYDELRLATV